jgi:hypothetical protein
VLSFPSCTRSIDHEGAYEIDWGVDPRDTPEAIMRDLAACPEPALIYHAPGDGEDDTVHCALCGNLLPRPSPRDLTAHAPTCPWARALSVLLEGREIDR